MSDSLICYIPHGPHQGLDVVGSLIDDPVACLQAVSTITELLTTYARRRKPIRHGAKGDAIRKAFDATRRT